MFRFLGRRLGVDRALRGLRPGPAAAEAARSVGAALLASDCVCCRRPMGWGRHGVCEACWDEAAPFGEPRCRGCGGSIRGAEGDTPRRCAACREAPGPFAGLAAYGRYSGRLRELVHALKFHDRPGLAKPLGSLLASTLVEAGLAGREDGALLVPVPLSRTRLSKRGYNQSDLLARSAGRTLRRETGRRHDVASALVKILDTPPQAGRTRSDRLKAASRAYAPIERAKPRIEGRRAILIDDVYTTGATAAACCDVLRDMGARDVVVAVVALTTSATDR